MSEFYHTYNRGVEKRKIFLERRDYFRGVHDLYEFNDVNIVININRRFDEIDGNGIDGNRTSIIYRVFSGKPKEKLVNIITWSLMPNHYHLFLNPVVDNGVSKFHQKFGGGFTNFFNTKHKRSGVLFQGGYKKIEVANDTQALQLICYIHANPLDLWKPNWKEKGLTDSETKEALKFLEKEYRWSSHLDWWGIKNFPSLIDTNSMSRFFKDPEEYREFFVNWLKYYSKNIDTIQKLVLE